MTRILRISADQTIENPRKSAASASSAYLLIQASIHVAIAVAAMAMPVSSQDVPQSQSDARARELIRRAREAMGGEADFAGIQTFRASGKFRRTVKYVSVQSPTKVVEKERRLSGKVEIEIALPDKFRKRVKGESMRGFGYSYAEIVNGGEAWRDPPLRAISSNRDGRVIDVSDFERTEWMSSMSAKHQLSYYTLGFLLQPLPGFPLAMSYAGEYQESDGKVDVVIAQNGGGFRALLLFDSRTHLLKALAFRFVESVQQTVMVETAGFFDRRFMQETFARARRERQVRAKPPREYELQLRFSDYRSESGLEAGLQLPHRVTTTLNGEVVEEMTVGEFELNRPINPKRFLREAK